MFTYLGSLVNGIFDSPLKVVLVVVSLLVAAALIVSFRKTMRLTDGTNELDGLFGLVTGSVLGALTGVLWAYINPIQLAPGIHLRLFAFLPPVIGILFGRGTGFISGYVATLVWAQISGLFVPFHTPLVDGIFVGLTGWFPAFLIRGDRSLSEMLKSIETDRRGWYIKTGLVCLFAGLFMSVFVGISLEATIALPFWTGFGLIGIASDTPPMILFTGLLVWWLLRSTKRNWNWFRTF